MPDKRKLTDEEIYNIHFENLSDYILYMNGFSVDILNVMTDSEKLMELQALDIAAEG